MSTARSLNDRTIGLPRRQERGKAPRVAPRQQQAAQTVEGQSSVFSNRVFATFSALAAAVAVAAIAVAASGKSPAEMPELDAKPAGAAGGTGSPDDNEPVRVAAKPTATATAGTGVESDAEKAMRERDAFIKRSVEKYPGIKDEQAIRAFYDFIEDGPRPWETEEETRARMGRYTAAWEEHETPKHLFNTTIFKLMRTTEPVRNPDTGEKAFYYFGYGVSQSSKVKGELELDYASSLGYASTMNEAKDIERNFRENIIGPWRVD